MANQTGIAITIKAWLPTGKTLDEQFEALSKVKDAHKTGDYAALLTASKIEGVQTEQKTRRIEDAPQTATQGQDGGQQSGDESEQEPKGEDNAPNENNEPVIEPQTAALKKAMAGSKAA